MSHWDFGRAPAEQQDETIPAEGDFPYGPGEVTYRRDDGELAGGARDAGDLEDQELWPYPITYERDWLEPVAPESRPADAPDAPDAPDESYDLDDPDDPYEIWPPAPVPDDRYADGQLPGREFENGPRAWPSPPRSGTRPKRAWPGEPDRRWLIAAGVALAAAAVVVVGTTVLLSSGHPGTVAATRPTASALMPAPSAQAARQTTAPPPSATAAPPLTLAQARDVLAGYTAGNNRANAMRSATRLAAIETGSSYAIDAALYLTARASGTAPYPAFEPASAAYYIPRSEPAAGPRWFAAEVGNAFARSPNTVTSVEYLLFLQAAPGAPWQNAIEPYLRPGANAPRIMVGGDGLATAVAPAVTSLAVAPVQLPTVTASSFDGSGPMAVPGTVADRTDLRAWQRKAPTLTITDRHAPATAGQAFALRTAGGGALVFYTVGATLTITPPAGSVFHLGIPGLQSADQALRRAVLQYRDQFAAYDPPAGSGAPRVIADYSGITRKM